MKVKAQAMDAAETWDVLLYGETSKVCTHTMICKASILTTAGECGETESAACGLHDHLYYLRRKRV